MKHYRSCKTDVKSNISSCSELHNSTNFEICETLYFNVTVIPKKFTSESVLDSD
ncbi:hypothetical protein T07_4985 [Trichinella nelsoni]|uniref:Uncharacterized protein n=1 Tax=Trichinella nelsoni TaxID=6336 RepID=A0A0V0RCK6_9BILA|nr:hypothetical protein T07_4985 [Trichinella nelsoni]